MIYQLIKNKKGFLSVQFVPVLMAFFAIMFGFIFLSFVSQAKMQFRTDSLNASIAMQKRIIQFEKQLFLLNKPAKLLRVTKLAKQIEMAVAIASENWSYAAKLELEILQITEKQNALDKIQKGIIKAAEIYIFATNTQNIINLNNRARGIGSQWSQFLNWAFIVTPGNSTVMSVKPDSSETAPEYGLTDDYKQAQTVAYKWQLRFFTKDDKQRFVSTKQRFELFYAVVPQEGKPWSLEIKKDKF